MRPASAGKTIAVTLMYKFPRLVHEESPASRRPRRNCWSKAGTPPDGRVGSEVLYLNDGKPEWQTLSNKAVPIPGASVGVAVKIVVPKVACEIFFDTLMIEAQRTRRRPHRPPVAAATPKPTPPGTHGAGSLHRQSQPLRLRRRPLPAPPVDDPKKALAAKATKRSLDDGGIQFGPEEALRLQSDANANKATAYSVLAIGPGFADKETFKFNGGWKPLPLPASLAAAKSQPRALMAALPEVLVKSKPEVVLISTDTTGARKASATEAEDWEDVARLCERFGAAPVLMTPPPLGKRRKTKGKKDENLDLILAAVRKVRDLNNLPVVYLKPAETLSKRISVCLNLLDTFVFLRNKPDDPATAKPKPKAADE